MTSLPAPPQDDPNGSAATRATGPATSSMPGQQELQVWRRFLRTHSYVLRRLEADLVAEHSLPLASYDVLVQLVEAPERRLRMTELAELVLLSRSGLTRMVDRLEREGLVAREAVPSDARGLYAVLTEAGYRRLRDASGTHLRGVRAYVTSRWDDPTLACLNTALGAVLDEPEPPPAL